MRFFKKTKYFWVLIFFISFFFSCFAVNYSFAINNVEQESAFVAGSGLSFNNIGDIAGTVISAFLGLLGIIFLGLMVYAGYNWMTASGDSEKMETAKNTIRRAIIGLIIIVSAYAITYFVFSKLPGTGSGSSNPGVTTSGTQ